MEKSERETHGSEIDCTNVQVAEEEPPKQPDNENRIITLTAGENEGLGCESEHNPQPIVEQGDEQAEKASESSKMVQKPMGEIPDQIGDQPLLPEADRCLEGLSLEQGELPRQVQVGQVTELVLVEAAICELKQEPMEEAVDIEEPQKYAFREKASD